MCLVRNVFRHYAALEGSDEPCSESNSSMFMDGLSLWCAVMCDYRRLTPVATPPDKGLYECDQSPAFRVRV